MKTILKHQLLLEVILGIIAVSVIMALKFEIGQKIPLELAIIAIIFIIVVLLIANLFPAPIWRRRNKAKV